MKKQPVFCATVIGRNINDSIFLLMLCVALNSCSAQPIKTANTKLEGSWIVHFTHRDIGTARTSLTFEGNVETFIAFSRKNADRDILGRWYSFWGRLFTSSMNEGCLLRIEQGVHREINDTLHLAGIGVTPMGKFNVQGYVFADTLVATISSKSRGALGAVNGYRGTVDESLENYAQLFDEIEQKTQDNIYNRTVLTTRKWNTFAKKMQNSTPKFQDDLEMVFAFFYRASKLPFSHYALMKPATNGDTSSRPSKPRLPSIVAQQNKGVALLRIPTFGGSAHAIDSVFDIIIGEKYETLIVDLRNNTGGSVEAGMAFARNVIERETYGGIFLTQKWFNENSSPPAPQDYVNFPHFSEANYDLIIEGIHNAEGICLKIKPREKVFTGRMYVLINNRTASTCEPIVYELKKSSRATIVGETTSGSMLNGEPFLVGDGFTLFIPTADYYASDGFRIDQNGVTPDVKAKCEEALEIALRIINKNN